MCEGVTVQFHDLFSANDVVSARLWRVPAASCGDDRLRVAMLATRADRPLRTQSFMEWLTHAPEFDLVAPKGHAFRNPSSSRSCRYLVALHRR